MVTLDLRKKFATKATYRGSQTIFGERRHLEEVLRSIRQAKLSQARKQWEIKMLTKLIETRTEELNRISPAWDRKISKARDPKTTPDELVRLAQSLSPDDYLLARLLTEHPEAPSEVLDMLATHPYSTVRENVARHPHTSIEVLARMAENPDEPLWFLVACNLSAPQELRNRLRARMRKTAAPRE